MNLLTGVSKWLLVAVLIGAVAYGATKGDGTPFAKYGAVQVAGFDGGLLAPKCLALANQNTIMVRNYQTDGGTGAVLYCGFDTSVTEVTGMPVVQKESLTVDMVSVTQGNIPVPFDGGISNTAPKLCCIGLAGANPSDLHWMIVK